MVIGLFLAVWERSMLTFGLVLYNHDVYGITFSFPCGIGGNSHGLSQCVLCGSWVRKNKKKIYIIANVIA